MSNSRRFRRGLRVSTEARVIRFPEQPPSIGTVRRWLKQGVAEGVIERAGEQHTGKPGRPAHLWQLTEAGKARAKANPPRGLREQLPDLLAKRAYALMRKGMSENQAIAAVTRGWRRAAS